MGAGAEGEVRPCAWKRGLKLKWKLGNEEGGPRSSSQLPNKTFADGPRHGLGQTKPPHPPRVRTCCYRTCKRHSGERHSGERAEMQSGTVTNAQGVGCGARMHCLRMRLCASPCARTGGADLLRSAGVAADAVVGCPQVQHARASAPRHERVRHGIDGRIDGGAGRLAEDERHLIEVSAGVGVWACGW